MENRVPVSLRGKNLSKIEYCENLRHFARNGFAAISFTGGEPTLNPDLPYLVAFAREHFEKVELTTNGFLLVDLLPELSKSLTLLKVSLDALSPDIVARVTRGTTNEAGRAISAIREGCKAGILVGVNLVAMRSTLSEIPRVVDLCRRINSEGHRGKCYLSILDFYYSAERREVWQREFVDVRDIEPAFKAQYGDPRREYRFGCQFFWFDADGLTIRLKQSSGATLRAAKCHRCRSFCQEGIYGLKHSAEGWITTCPSNDSGLGAYLYPGITDTDADRMLRPILTEILNAAPDPKSFQQLLAMHKLTLESKWQTEIPPAPLAHDCLVA